MSFFRKKYIHEAFLSHAIEDRAAIATELYVRLEDAGIKMWYSANSLSTGDDLEKEIEKAIEDSRFGIVVLTKNSISRPWPLTEYNWLRKKELKGIKVILPVVHDMAFEEIMWPGVSAKYCIHSNRGMDFVVKKIIKELDEYREVERIRKRNEAWLISSMTLILALLISLITYRTIHDRPTDEQIENSINDRIEKLSTTVVSDYTTPSKLQGSLVSQNKIDSARLAYENYKSYYRNEYEFNNGSSLVRARKNVYAALSQDPADIANSVGYGMDSLDIFWSRPVRQDGFISYKFSYINKRPVVYAYKGHKEQPVYIVKVDYTNHIQYINVTLTIPPSSTGTKRHEMTLVGFAPSEIFYFEKDREGEWHLLKVE